MSTRLLPMGLLVVCVLLPVLLYADAADHAKDRAALIRAVQKMDAAFQNRDVKGYIAFTAPDFKDTNVKGIVTVNSKEERRVRGTRLFSKINHVKEHSTVNSINFANGRADVTITSESSFNTALDGANVLVKTRSVYRDVWIKSSIGWIEKSSRAISRHRTIDGKPVE